MNESAIQGQVLAAAITQGVAHAMRAKPKSFFHVDSQEILKGTLQTQVIVHTKKDSRICPKYKKGKHWASECKFVINIEGKPLPKNDMRGPWAWAPQIFEALKEGQPAADPIRMIPRIHYPLIPSSDIQQEAQDWTSVPPPE